MKTYNRAKKEKKKFNFLQIFNKSKNRGLNRGQVTLFCHGDKPDCFLARLIFDCHHKLNRAAAFAAAETLKHIFFNINH